MDAMNDTQVRGIIGKGKRTGIGDGKATVTRELKDEDVVLVSVRRQRMTTLQVPLSSVERWCGSLAHGTHRYI